MNWEYIETSKVIKVARVKFYSYLCSQISIVNFRKRGKIKV